MMALFQLLYPQELVHSNIVLMEGKHFLKQTILQIYLLETIVFQLLDLLAAVYLKKILQLNLVA